jgi:hypothetical protein
MAVWPALTRPDPPAEAAGDDGLRIRVVEPPKTSVARAGPLDVGLSEAAQAMAKGREALFAGTPMVRPTPAPPPMRLAPVQVAQADEEDDLAPTPEPVEDQWDRDRAESGYELAQQRWEEERLARRDPERRAAWEQDQRERRTIDEPRPDDRYDPPPAPVDDRPPPNW